MLGLPRILTYYSKSRITKLYDKHDDVLFRIINFPLCCGNSPSAPEGNTSTVRHTEFVDKHVVSISIGAPSLCSRLWRSPSCSCTFSFMCIFIYFICASRCICLRFHCIVFVP
jgi:hypothetical protein